MQITKGIETMLSKIPEVLLVTQLQQALIQRHKYSLRSSERLHIHDSIRESVQLIRVHRSL